MTDQQRGGVQGWKEFLAEKHDLMRAYESAAEKAASRPLKTEPGSVAEGVFRRWLSGFLPERYGVTSGYIISQGLTDQDPVRHFDVLIYDKVESPVLWHENNPDRSESGQHRPIPVEHVLAAFEVKASLTKQSVSKAITKLRELNPLLASVDQPEEPYPKYLPARFFCGTVFFRIDLAQKSEILSPLIAPDVRGYSGGVVLSTTKEPMCTRSGAIRPLVGNQPIAAAGSTLEKGVAMLEGIQFNSQWHSLMLVWEANSFQEFAYTLLALLRGKYRPGFLPSFHGFSSPDGALFRESQMFITARDQDP